MRCAAIFFLLLLAVCARAQPTDRNAIDTANQYAFRIHETEPDSALHISREQLRLSAQAAYRKGQGDACMTIGAVYRLQTNYSESDRYFSQALGIRRTLGDSNRVAAVFINLGINQFELNEYGKAVSHVTQAIRILEAARLSGADLPLLGSAYLLLSNIYDEYLDPAEAMNYARKSLRTYVAAGQVEHVARAAYALGNRFQLQGQADSSLVYYDLAYNNIMASSKAPFIIADIQTNKGLVFTGKGDFKRAGMYFDQAEEMLQRMGEEADYFHFYLNKAEWFIRQGRLQQGLEYLYKARSAHTRDNLLDAQSLYETMAGTYASLQRYDSAFYYLSKAYSTRDSIYNDNKSRLFVRYGSDLLKQELARKAAENQQQTARNRQLLVTAVLLLVIAGILAVAFVQRRKAFRVISRQKETLHRQAIDELIQASQLKFLNAGIEGGEAVREHIAGEIHDRLGSAMVTLIWQYDALLEDFPAGSPQYRQMEKLNGALKQLYNDIRLIAHQLGSGVLERVGLVPVLEELCADLASSNKMEVDFSCYGLDHRLSFFQEINILRIIQELVGNTLKYAGATQLAIQIDRIDGELNIMVEDNGRGFDPLNARGRGAGLSNVENRARALNGTVQVESHPETGTSVILRIPDPELLTQASEP